MTTPRNDILFGDVREVLRGLDEGSVNCIITSPPYWSLRKYDIPDIDWTDGYVGQLGLEPTIDLYLSHLMQVMDECKRVLRDDGTMWVNIGDSYNSNAEGPNPGGFQGGSNSIIAHPRQAGSGRPGKSKTLDIPTKSLCLIPERFAIEMVNRGWILRNKIIWHKPNCMPSSVKDRFTVDWEPVYFFTKSRRYWFEQQYDSYSPNSKPDEVYTGQATKEYLDAKAQNPSDTKRRILESMRERQGRNRRCVWTIPTQPYPESHFATFPERLVEPMILAGCPKEVCKKCGQPRSKIKAVTSHYTKREKAYVPNNAPDKVDSSGWEPPTTEEIGETDCGCGAGFDPGIVLDPFIGSGTVAKVASRLERDFLGIELGDEYIEMAWRRIMGIKLKDVEDQIGSCEEANE